MTLKHIIAMIAGILAGRWIKDLVLQFGLAQIFANVAGPAAGSVITAAIATS